MSEIPEEKNVQEPSARMDQPISSGPDRLEDKKKVWTRRIIGAIVFFSILGCLALLAAAQAVSFMFKTILTP